MHLWLEHQAKGVIKALTSAQYAAETVKGIAAQSFIGQIAYYDHCLSFLRQLQRKVDCKQSWNCGPKEIEE